MNRMIGVEGKVPANTEWQSIERVKLLFRDLPVAGYQTLDRLCTETQLGWKYLSAAQHYKSLLPQSVAAAPDRPGGAGAERGEPSSVAPHAHAHARDRRRDAAAAAHVCARAAAHQVTHWKCKMVQADGSDS